ncbi:hypothetical protein [Variovorax sp. EBFNA2]|uniref:hypothetical protein n=1 Tax=Variovorax sp. EBFNA2 TaxID=3342097 RepID=UPI0029C09B94|nr:hypothetical protein [Variovorax boronicumulans]WPG35150.1 hypothetical protein RZE79_16795 [Variovorax boronicumulans]
MRLANAPTAPITAAVNAQPLRRIQRAAFRSGGATGYPREVHMGPLNASAMRSSQCFAFQRCQIDFFSMRGLSSDAQAEGI